MKHLQVQADGHGLYVHLDLNELSQPGYSHRWLHSEAQKPYPYPFPERYPYPYPHPNLHLYPIVTIATCLDLSFSIFSSASLFFMFLSRGHRLFLLVEISAVQSGFFKSISCKTLWFHSMYSILPYPYPYPYPTLTVAICLCHSLSLYVFLPLSIVFVSFTSTPRLSLYPTGNLRSIVGFFKSISCKSHPSRT
jgi:hypothetical protein